MKQRRVLLPTREEALDTLLNTDVDDTYKVRGIAGLALLYREGASELRATLREIEALTLRKTKLANLLLEVEEKALQKEETRFTLLHEAERTDKQRAKD